MLKGTPNLNFRRSHGATVVNEIVANPSLGGSSPPLPSAPVFVNHPKICRQDLPRAGSLDSLSFLAGIREAVALSGPLVLREAILSMDQIIRIAATFLCTNTSIGAVLR